MPTKPDAFLSFTRFDDRHGQISEFRRYLSNAVEEVSGVPYSIFQDVDDEAGIALGQRWNDRLDEMLDQARFFIPILTPKFFNSAPCRDELTKFLELERRTSRQDLVLPIYWITCPVLEDPDLKAKDKLAQAIDERQRWDWREMRFLGLDSADVRRGITGLASVIERARRNVVRFVDVSNKIPAENNKVDVPRVKKINDVSRDKLFVSYSRKDKEFLDSLKTVLAPIINNNIVEFWDDTTIKPGDDWKIEIELALKSARAAILIVTPNFLASEFIQDNELPELLRAEREDDVKIFWIAARDSLYEFTKINDFQCVNNPATPLESLTSSERNKAMVLCGKAIASAMGIKPLRD